MKRLGLIFLSLMILAGTLCACTSPKETSSSSTTTTNTGSGHHYEAHDPNHHK